MRVTVVGSGTATPSPERVCASYFVEAGDNLLLLDCGAGALHHMARFGLPWQRLTHLVVSHFHADHIGDLPNLLFSLKHGIGERRVEPITVLGPMGTVGLFRRMSAAFGSYLMDPGFPFTIREMGEGDLVDLGTNARISAHPTPHTVESLAFRVTDGQGSLGYTGDTGPSDELGEFFRGVDVLIAECSLPDEVAIDTHLSPSSVARLARLADPRLLLLTHLFPQIAATDAIRLVRDAGWQGPTDIATDGRRLEIPGSLDDEPDVP